MSATPDDTGALPKPSGRRLLRYAVLLLAGAECLLLITYIGIFADALGSSDPLGRAIAQGVVTLATIPLALALPAFVLGVLNRWLPLALSLTVLAVPVAVVLFRYA
jgi:hypothetical protein